MLPLLGDDLDSSTLHLYLKELTFVEYFNSFLLLPAFSSRLFFDQESGYFEPVHGEGTKLCWGEGGELTPSSSQATLYLTDENMGPALDRLQSWSWIIEHRLPLFLKSDLYSEYKLCKLISSQTDNRTTSTLPSPAKSLSSTKLQSLCANPVKRHRSDEKATDTSLPSIQRSSSSLILENVSTTSLTSSPKITKNADNKRQNAQLRRQRSHSVDLSGQHLMDGQPTKMTSEEAKLIGSKSGMNHFWKFLRGKAGEKNWLFWLDAERVGYHTSPLEQQRMLRELRERYLHSSGPLVLPAEIRNKVRVNKTSRLTVSQLKDLQHILVQGLKEYWCPRFLVHYYTEAADPTLSPQSTKPVSCAPVTLQLNDGHLTNYPRVSTPLTPTGTPTFRRLTSGRHRSYSSPTSYRKAQEERGSKLFSRFRTDGGLSAEDSETILRVKAEGGGSRSHSRRVWDEQKVKSEASNPKGKKSHFNRVAKYTHHHVPDSNSRCASTMDGQTNNGGMCETQCTILSVSGTPLHTIPPTPTHPHTITEHSPSLELYGPLISCLNTEHRKAGGYFQQHLEGIEEKVFLYCLEFWREVQEYKALFIGASFSPCTVEMKAKTLYGRFISKSSEQCIECPQLTGDTVCANLWPAYEDLFDCAEEHVLSMLLLKWVEMVTSEDKLFQTLDCVPTRKLSGRVSRSRASPALEELEEEEHFSDEVDGYDDSYFLRPSSSKRHSRPSSSRKFNRMSSESSSRQRLPGAESRAVSLNDIIANRVELDYFKIYLNEHCAAQDLMCWLEIEAFRGIPVGDKTIRNMKAKQLKTQYFNKTYLFGANSPANKEAQRQIVQAGGGAYTGRLPPRPRTPVFIEAQKHVRARLEKKWLVEFITTPEYLSRNRGSVPSANGKRLSRVNGKEIATNYETSFGNSHEAITFRKMLHDKHQVDIMLRYLNIKAIGGNSGNGSHAKQDVEFWLEVQKYKEMCHAHTTESMLANKATAIIDCYFQSAVPPKLQVDVPLSVADELTRKHKGPYLFREAQAAVFKYLYTCWLDYKNYSSGYGADEIQVSLDRLQSQLIKDKNAEKDRKVHELIEEERRKMSAPRFETMAEKLERARIEKERAEIGDVQVAFRLSNPDHSYTYYTALPEEFAGRQLVSEHPHSENKPAKQKDRHKRHTEVPETKKQQNVSQPSSDVDPLPMVVVKLDKPRDAKKHAKAPVAAEETEMDFEQTIQDRLPMKPNVSNQQLLLQKQNSQTFFHSNSKHNATSPPQTFKNFPVSSSSRPRADKFAPHTTISMRRSGEKGGVAYPYGAGLPKEQSSITVMNVETS